VAWCSVKAQDGSLAPRLSPQPGPTGHVPFDLSVFDGPMVTGTQEPLYHLKIVVRRGSQMNMKLK